MLLMNRFSGSKYKVHFLTVKRLMLPERSPCVIPSLLHLTNARYSSSESGNIFGRVSNEMQFFTCRLLTLNGISSNLWSLFQLANWRYSSPESRNRFGSSSNKMQSYMCRVLILGARSGNEWSLLQLAKLRNVSWEIWVMLDGMLTK